MTAPDPEIGRAYRIMADLGFRPAAPRTGELPLAKEIQIYSRHWIAEEDGRIGAPHEFHIGTPSLEMLTPLVLTIEAARLICRIPDSETRHVITQLLQRVIALVSDES